MPPRPETARCFIAIPLPDEVKAACEAAVAALKPGAPTTRWVRPEAMHLTLQFLGNVDRERLPALGAALQETVGTHRSLTLRTDGIERFGNARQPRVFWLDVGGDVDRLAALQAAIVDVTAGFGIEPEDRPFRPHVTLGRVKDRRPTVPPDWWAGVTAPAAVEWRVKAVHLMESALGSTGARYSTIALCSLVIQ